MTIIVFEQAPMVAELSLLAGKAAKRAYRRDPGTGRSDRCRRCARHLRPRLFGGHSTGRDCLPEVSGRMHSLPADRGATCSQFETRDDGIPCTVGPRIWEEFDNGLAPDRFFLDLNPRVSQFGTPESSSSEEGD